MCEYQEILKIQSNKLEYLIVWYNEFILVEITLVGKGRMDFFV